MEYGNLFYSATTNGFYDDAYHTKEQIPSDAKPITRDEHNNLMNGQYLGKVITSQNGLPILMDRVITADENKSKAAFLIQETDWVNQPDVYDESVTPHLLNRSEFLSYRSSLREVVVNPMPGLITFPNKPSAQWSN
jgi:hypothetical protein